MTKICIKNWNFLVQNWNLCHWARNVFCISVSNCDVSDGAFISIPNHSTILVNRSLKFYVFNSSSAWRMWPFTQTVTSFMRWRGPVKDMTTILLILWSIITLCRFFWVLFTSSCCYYPYVNFKKFNGFVQWVVILREKTCFTSRWFRVPASQVVLIFSPTYHLLFSYISVNGEVDKISTVFFCVHKKLLSLSVIISKTVQLSRKPIVEEQKFVRLKLGF